MGEEEGGEGGERGSDGDRMKGGGDKRNPRVRSLSLSNPQPKRSRSKSKKKPSSTTLNMKRGLRIGRGSERIGRKVAGDSNWEIFPRRTMFFAFFSPDHAHIWTYNWSLSQVFFLFFPSLFSFSSSHKSVRSLSQISSLAKSVNHLQAMFSLRAMLVEAIQVQKLGLFCHHKSSLVRPSFATMFRPGGGRGRESNRSTGFFLFYFFLLFLLSLCL